MVERGTLHVHTTDGGKVYTLHDHTAGGGKGYTLHVNTANGGEGYNLHVHAAGVMVKKIPNARLNCR